MNIKVLVADKSSEVREKFTRSLKEIGVQNVMEANDANTAINLLKQEQFNAVLADGKIQTESGKGLVEEIRHIDSNVPIIVTTNQAELSPAFEKKHPSASAYLTPTAPPRSTLRARCPLHSISRENENQRVPTTFP